MNRRLRPIRGGFGRGAGLVAGKRLGEFFDPGLLHSDDPFELGDPFTARAVVLGFDVGAVAVVAGAAGGCQVSRIPHRAALADRDDVVDGVGDLPAAWPLDSAEVLVAGEYLAAEALPGCRAVAAVAHRPYDASPGRGAVRCASSQMEHTL